MYEETKHITARLQVLEFLMTQANLADLFRHTDILLFVLYAQNVAKILAYVKQKKKRLTSVVI